MFSFYLNKMTIQRDGSDGVNPPRRKLPLLEAVGLRRATAQGEPQDGQSAEQPAAKPVAKSAARRSREKRHTPDRRKAVGPMLPDRQNAGDRRKKDRRRPTESA